MIKCLIYDLDGVIFLTGRLQLAALNEALLEAKTNLQISEEEDMRYYGTVPSKDKLKILSKLKGLPEDKHQDILDLKKKFITKTMENIPLEQIFPDNVKECIEKLSKEYTLYIASNSNYNFISHALMRAGIKEYFTKIFCGSDVTHPKPNPEMYLKVFIDAGVAPSDCLIFEDSISGQEAAVKSGAYVYGIESPKDLNYDKIKQKINSIKPQPVKWCSEKINVVIPMAGEGQRFKDEGFTTPKPIIDVEGLPMVGLVAHKLDINANFIFVVKGEHCAQYNLESILRLMYPTCTIVKTWGKQCGAACSILEAEPYINNDQHLLIVNSDQIWDWNARLFYHKMIVEELDGGIVVFKDEDRNPKWSFAKVDENDYVTEVAEKNPISDLGTAGIYYFKYGSDFVKFAKQMIEKKITINSEYYTCPVYNELIEAGKRIKAFPIEKMIGLGVPSDLKLYLNRDK